MVRDGQRLDESDIGSFFILNNSIHEIEKINVYSFSNLSFRVVYKCVQVIKSVEVFKVSTLCL